MPISVQIAFDRHPRRRLHHLRTELQPAMARVPSPPIDFQPEGSSLPAGYRFFPNDRQMVEKILMNKVLGSPLSSFSDMKEGVDVYLRNPDELIPDRGGDDVWGHFFLTRAEDHDTIVGSHRCTPGGYWMAAKSEKAVVNGDRTIGFMNHLVFYRGDAPNVVKTDWEMVEYRVNPDLEELKNLNDPKIENYVACRIYKDEPNLESTSDDSESDPESVLDHPESDPDDPESDPGEI